MNGFVFNILGFLGLEWVIMMFMAMLITLRVMDVSTSEANEGGKNKDVDENKTDLWIRGNLLAVLMFMGYLLFVGLKTADEEVILSQNECTKEKLEDYLKGRGENEGLKVYKVAEFAEECRIKKEREVESKEKKEAAKKQLEWLKSEKEK